MMNIGAEVKNRKSRKILKYTDFVLINNIISYKYKELWYKL